MGKFKTLVDNEELRRLRAAHDIGIDFADYAWNCARRRDVPADVQMKCCELQERWDRETRRRNISCAHQWRRRPSSTVAWCDRCGDATDEPVDAKTEPDR